eukprot:TRINITY_DN48352_c0_g1_i1.p1 TRINITY_DN48352_c0_g1~~TRINITY_DN48352_c0_g1_i1.p1  ORF type:complete len:1070 (+),score=175.40 TRINITY_DN48352_c0_g1_i1:133-3342(+)
MAYPQPRRCYPIGFNAGPCWFAVLLWVATFAELAAAAKPGKRSETLTAVTVSDDGRVEFEKPPAISLMRRQVTETLDDTTAQPLGGELLAEEGFREEGVTSLGCMKARAAEDIPVNEKCPSECPFWAEDTASGTTCNFKCVTDAQCGETGSNVNPNTTVADKAGMFCRSCKAAGCKTCGLHDDSCIECSVGFYLNGSKCSPTMVYPAYVLAAFLGLQLIYFTVWILDFLCRATPNDIGVKRGLEFRSRTKLRMPRDKEARDAILGVAAAATEAAAETAEDALAPASGGEADSATTAQPPVFEGSAEEPSATAAASDLPSRPLWPLTTNLCRTPVAGPGTVLHFRFQVAVMIWGALALLGWGVMVASTDKEVLQLGWKSTDTPRELCRVVNWGRTLQETFMWEKMSYIGSLYAFTFLGSIGFAILQLRTFQSLDEQTTMKDYAALCTNLPRLPGSAHVEEDLKKALEESSGQKVVGVSICWDFHEHADTLASALDEQMNEVEEAMLKVKRASLFPAEDINAAEIAEPQQGVSFPQTLRTSVFGGFENMLLVTFGGSVIEPQDKSVEDISQQSDADASVQAPPDVTEASAEAAEATKPIEPSTKDILMGMTTCSTAIVVFESESQRDEAVATVFDKNGMAFQGSTVKLEKLEAEPETIRWADFSLSVDGRPGRFLRGIGVLLLGLLGWALVVYMPYAMYMTSFSYENGDEPHGVVAMVFPLVVTVANILLYLVCSNISEYIGFWFEDNREAAYMVMYASALVLNLFLDLAVAAWLAYKEMVNKDAHTFGGKKFSELTDWHEIGESYPMQKSMGIQLYLYAFPATFLTPFLIEPLATIAIPFLLACRLVRTRPELRGREAEKPLAVFTPMDTGRYADILGNVIIASLVFFVPAGFVIPMLAGLVASHVYIYMFDHYKVLRCVPAFSYSSLSIDRCALRMLSIPCGMMLIAMLCKVNCEKGSHLCISNGLLGILCLDVFVIHVIVHLALLNWVVPIFGLTNHERSPQPYAKCASSCAASYFTTNPVHALRSNLIYEHNPPCGYFVRGKEHLLKANPKIGLYFEDDAVTRSEEF